jgi:glycerate kinase
MAQALGVVFLDAAGVEIGLGSGQYLSDIADIDLSGLDERIGKTEFIIASDVRNPLCGPDGAAYVYGPQKGATPEMVKRLDAGLANYAAVIEEKTDRSVKNSPGAGAAGGLGAGLMAFLGAQMQSGVEVIMDAIDFDRRLKGVDLVLTGEGRIDGQTLYGKVVSGVAGRAKSENIRVIAIAGEVTADAKPLLDKGVSDMHQFVRPNMTYEYAISHAGELLEEETAEILAEME